MKKIFYLFAITAFVFTSCNPLEDVNAEVDALKLAETGNDGLVEDLVITLTEDDYTSLDLNNFYFSTEDEAKNGLPGFLSTMYPKLGVDFDVNGVVLTASSAVVTYNLFNPESAITKKSYTLTAADYTDIGLTALNDNSDVNTFFSAKFSSEIKGTIYDLTYLTDPTIEEYTFTDEDFDLVGNGRFDNFDIRAGRAEEDLEVRRAKIQTVLQNNFPAAEFGTKYNVTYEAYNGSTVNLDLLVQLEENPTDPLKTTNYTLVDEDYELIGNGAFNNFDIRDTSPDSDVQVRREKIQTILLNNYPDALAGDFFVITYDTYDGAGRPVLNMILQFDGTDYTIFDVKIYAFYDFTLEANTNRFVLTDNWNAPITFTAEEYGIMGGSSRYSNFSGNAEEAERKIKVYMKTLYPFAAANDFLAVQYNFFSGGVSAINMNLTFDGTNWTSLSESTEIVLQFGHDGVTWVPDNTIKYTLSQADYDLVGNGFRANFDVRADKGEFELSVRLEKVNTILSTNYPQYGIDQKFSVSYNVWEPGDAVYIMNVINNGTAYVLQ
ncbi:MULTISPECIES: hypothetical protein [unclassified Polaribacter]|uniref:hypothetical protein n=1 Tax=unclassified Polaribacter TaxID=196858 RepID=UPI0011BF9EDC|nr:MULTISPECIES: hypothetical protein [unclassified Polaribacter]TXD52443.1 hypothetical protein ES043_08605 [Polaribacter sp. IC063]TXD61081.1 hypothetical protein ES044_05875 [Polaribacter sp. IC066]